MARPKKQKEESPSEDKPEVKGVSDSLIKTVSEVESLSDEEREAFRHAGGTTISNPE